MTNLMIYGVYALNPFLRTCGAKFKTTSLVHGAKMTEIISPVQGCLKMAILSSLTFEGNCNASVSQSLHLYSVGGGLGLIWQQQLQGQALKKSLRTDYLKILLKLLWWDLQFKHILRELLDKYLAKKVNQASEAVDLHPIVEPQIHSRLGSLI